MKPRLERFQLRVDCCELKKEGESVRGIIVGLKVIVEGKKRVKEQKIQEIEELIEKVEAAE